MNTDAVGSRPRAQGMEKSASSRRHFVSSGLGALHEQGHAVSCEKSCEGFGHITKHFKLFLF
jgi:hypothetical protein